MPTGAPTGVSGADGGSDESFGDTAMQFDVDPGMASAENGDDKSGCDKVDFLFVIDNSGSMGDEQQQLIANFPQFITSIQNTLDDAQDYHVMVVDSDEWVFGDCDVWCTDPLLQIACAPFPAFVCGETERMECEDVLGAGVNYPRGGGSSNVDCQFDSGQRWMDSDQAGMHAAFACAAQVGTGSINDPERPMEAMVQAVTPSSAAWECNDGFLRDDAILVVTFITDEDDNDGDGSAGTVEGWKQALVSAKNGDESAIVVLGLYGDNDQPGAICPPLSESSGAEPSPRLRQFVDSFGVRGVSGSVCADDYQQFFLDAVDIIDTTCEDFIPPEG